MGRLEQIREMLAQEPHDEFLRYGLAMELAKQERYAEAIAAFEELLKNKPEYVPAYFMAGRTQEQAGEPEQARAWYERGIAMARKVGNHHAADEMTAALEAL